MPGVLTRRLLAPEFPRGFTWWNTDCPLTLHEDLKGQVVVLDFWTYCCINCVHTLANLAQVEERFKGQPVQVVGAHSPKYTNESESQNVRTAMLRLGVRHPVVVDEGHRIWTAYGIAAWPTLVFIDAEGRIAGTVSGEVQPREIESVVQSLLEEGRAHGILAARPLTLRTESMVPSASGLSFPGKVVADPAGGRLFIADSGHHRVLVTDPEGHMLLSVGTGEPGRADGPPDRASFRDPQGLACDPERNALWVADHGNHLVRRVDLGTGNVETILGTGAQVYDRGGGRRGRAQGLNSPWDLAIAPPHLYIAMAGTHQVWRMDLATLQAEAWVGSGREGLADGPGFNAALAQPSGLAILGDWLYFVDSETSALRRARLRDGDVETLAGHGLFEFGDVDGAYGRARLQHPLGVATDGHRIFVADTYNHKIREVDLEARTVGTVAGVVRPGVDELGRELTLHEPGGLAWLNGRLYVADTNNHRVIVLDPKDTEHWHELPIRRETGLDYLIPGYPVCAEISPRAETLRLELTPALVEGFHVNMEAARTIVIWEPEGRGGLLNIEGGRAQFSLSEACFPADLEIPVKCKAGSGRFIVDLSFASCTDNDHGLCKPEMRRWEVNWMRSAGARPHPLRLTGGMIGVR